MDLDKLINSRFKHAFADQETRNQLLWDKTEITLDQMVQKAQQFDDFKSNESVKPKTSLRVTDSSETSQLHNQFEEL